MKIQTNAGEVDLTADMVRPGMVFEHLPTGERRPVVPLLAGAIRDALRPPHVAALWHLLGCDPAVAAREDVERYGVAPGIDAGAHGFARLRGGGAVDLRRQENFSSQFVYEQILDGYAGRTSTGDICTLAIGDHDTHEDIATGTRWAAESDEALRERLLGAQRPRDLRSAAGSVSWIRAVVADAGYACDVERAAHGPGTVNVKIHGASWALCRELQERIASGMPADAAVTVEPVETAAGNGFRADGRPRGDETFCGSFDTRAQIVFSTNADAWEALAALREDGTFSCACGSSKPVEHAECCALPWQYRMAATWAVDYTNARGQGLQRVVAEGLFGACAVALLAWCCRLWDERPCGNCEATREHGEVVHHEDCPTDGMAAWPRKEQAMRRAAEAPLVALVAAVPKGLDPVGWRAAVLAVHEASGDRPTPDAWADAECEKALRIMVAIGVAADAYSDIEQLALDAYARAVAPQGPRPAPERKRGGRDVRLTVDDGSD